MLDFDLNLLKVMAAIDQTRSVSGAAAALQMSQPGVSSALARLRSQLGDALFVRTPHGMEPTPRATALLASAQELLAGVTAALQQGPSFDPATARTTFRIALSDLGEISVLPSLLADLQHSAPHADILTAAPHPTEMAAMLRDGSIDLALGYFPDLKGAGIFQQQLNTSGSCCLVRAGHPVKGPRMGRKEYETYGHVVVRTPVRSQELIHREIQQSRLKRRIVVQTSHFLTVPLIVARSDLIATVPRGLGVEFVEMGLLRAVRPPFPSTDFPIRQHWHARYGDDPRSQWLRSQVHRVLQGQA